MLDRSHEPTICCCDDILLRDAPALIRLYTDLQVRHFLGGPLAESVAIQRTRALIANDRPLPAWAIRSAGSNPSPLLGVVSLDPHHDGKEIEVSYVLLPENQGRGFATEAVRFALRHAFGQMSLTRVVAETQSSNMRSVALLKRIGMVLQRTVIRFGSEQSMYAALNSKLSTSP